jgi:drug/metabolite transporter (DMT)-like permease
MSSGSPLTQPTRTMHTPPGADSAGIRSILLMVAAVGFFGILDALAKYLTQSLPVLQVVWMRFLIHALLAFFILRLWQRRERMTTTRPVMQAVRGLFLVGTTVFNFLALLYLQLAETASIMFAGPIVIAALAVPLLGEKVGLHRWAAILVGFVGVLIVTRPGLGSTGLGGLGWPALLSVASMLCYSFYSLATRVLAQSQNTEGLIMYTALIPALVLAPFGLAVWVWPPDLFIWALILATGLTGGLGHYLVILAHQRTSASTLAPFTYSQMVWMVALGWLIFGDIPGLWTIIGASIVIGSGIYLLYREERARRLARKAPRPIPEIPS